MIEATSLMSSFSHKSHCSYCTLRDEDLKTDALAAYIFLDMDGVMIYRQSPKMNNAINRTLIELFGDKPNYTHLESFRGASRHLFPEAVTALMELVRKIEESGRRAGIVISSSWGHEVETHELLQMFETQPFCSYIAGRTPTDYTKDPLLTQRGNEIQSWLNLHHTVDRYVSLDDECLEMADQPKTNLGRRWVGITGQLGQNHLKPALAILKMNPYHCQRCVCDSDDVAPQLGQKVILFIQDPLIHEEGDQVAPELLHLIHRIKLTGAKIGCVMPASRKTRKPVKSLFRGLWVGRLCKDQPFHEEADSWAQAHQVKRFLKLDGTAKGLQVNQSMSRLGFVRHVAENRHCRFCLFDDEELPSLKKKSWIFLDIGDVLSQSMKERNERALSFPMTGDFTFDRTAIQKLTELIAKVKREVAIVITSDLRVGYTTQDLCAELCQQLPFGHLIKGRTASLIETDPEYQYAKEQKALSSLQYPLDPSTLSNAVHQWRNFHQIASQYNYITLTAHHDGGHTRRADVIVNNCYLKDSHCKMALEELNFPL